MAKQTDMSALEYRAAVAQFLPTVGLKAERYTSIENYGLMFSAAFYMHDVDVVDGEYGQPEHPFRISKTYPVGQNQ